MGPKAILGFNYCPPIGTRDNPTMTRDPSLNRAHQKAFYNRLKQDPVLWRAFLDRKAAYKRRVRSGATRQVAVPTTAALVEAISRRFAAMAESGRGPHYAVGIRSEDSASDKGGRPCR